MVFVVRVWAEEVWRGMVGMTVAKDGSVKDGGGLIKSYGTPYSMG